MFWRSVITHFMGKEEAKRPACLAQGLRAGCRVSLASITGHQDPTGREAFEEHVAPPCVTAAETKAQKAEGTCQGYEYPLALIPCPLLEKVEEACEQKDRRNNTGSEEERRMVEPPLISICLELEV